MAYQLDHGWQTEHERLTRIGVTLDPMTIHYLETIGVTTRWRCLEVGAGAGSMSRVVRMSSTRGRGGSMPVPL